MKNTVDPSTLVNHPDLDRIKMLEETAAYMAANAGSDQARQELARERTEEWCAFVDSITEHGVLEPIKVLEGSLFIVDGRHRAAAALVAGLDRVPIQYVTQAEADAIIDASVAGRRFWSKSMRAYFAVLRHPEALETKPGKPSKANPAQNAGLTEPDLAIRFGVSERLIVQAKQFVRETAGKEKLRERLEMSIWAGASLGGVLSGLGGATATLDKPKTPSSPWSAAKTLATFRSQLGGWSQWNAEQRDAFADEWRATWSELPADARQLMLEEIEAAAAA